MKTLLDTKQSIERESEMCSVECLQGQRSSTVDCACKVIAQGNYCY